MSKRASLEARWDLPTHVEYQSGSVSIRGRVISSLDTGGYYRLEIRSDNRLGSSNVSHAGQFHANANEPVFIGFANLNGGTGMRLAARLSVKARSDNFAQGRTSNFR